MSDATSSNCGDVSLYYRQVTCIGLKVTSIFGSGRRVRYKPEVEKNLKIYVTVL